MPKNDFSNRSLFVGIANNIPPGMDTVSVLKDTGLVAPVTQAVLPFVHFLRNNRPQGLHWASKFYPNERHGTVELVSEYDGLRSIFDYYQFRMSQFAGHPVLDEDSVVVAQYKMLSARFGYIIFSYEN